MGKEKDLGEEEIMMILSGEADFPQESSEERFAGMCVYDPDLKADCLGDHQNSDECPQDYSKARDCKYFQISK